ncbi:MAG TPA: hypothetical protein VHI98_26255, partial [Vicinamibacterales bacterium]|nr:hypothetical protein [Vicinamibacterales bacterium]
MRSGQEAERFDDYDRAVVEYTKAVREKPDDRNARLALDRAKLKASTAHYERGRRMAANRRFEEALLEYQLAAELNPTNADVDRELTATRNALRAKVAVAAEGQTALEALIQRTRDMAPAGQDLPQDVKLADTLVFGDASARAVYTTIARFADLNLVFDPAFRDSNISIDLRNVTLGDALTSVSSATRNFYRVTAPRTITIIPDTPAKRREYEEEIVRTFYLSNADLKETIDLLRIVIDARKIAPITGTNS